MSIKSNLILKENEGRWLIYKVMPDNTEVRTNMLLNESGAIIWRMMKEGYSENEIIKTLSYDFNTSEDVIRNDISIFINNLIKKDLCD